MLESIRVLDLADEKASFCSKLLADMGACVIKAERPGGDPSRMMGPFLDDSPHPERSLFFFHNNSNKLGITLNLEHHEGRKIFLKLVEKSDVAVESFSPGHLEELGLGFETLRGINPKLVLVSVTGFGQNGPRSKYKSCDIVASAFGGQMYVSGDPSMSPLKASGEQSYYTASLFAAIGVLLALRKRTRNGKGEHIDLSIQETVVSTLEHLWVQYFYENIIPERQGNLHWDENFCILRCKEGNILISLFQRWETLVEWMAGEGMAEDLTEENWKEEGYRREHLGHVIEVINRWTQTHTAHELFELGQLMQFPWAPVQSPKEVLNNPQLEFRRFFIEVGHPDIATRIKYPGTPNRYCSIPLDRWKRPPLVGEDNVRVYQTELGLSDEELEKLRSVHAI